MQLPVKAYEALDRTDPRENIWAIVKDLPDNTLVSPTCRTCARRTSLSCPDGYS
jgi:hypothetical protein